MEDEKRKEFVANKISLYFPVGPGRLPVRDNGREFPQQDPVVSGLRAGPAGDADDVDLPELAAQGDGSVVGDLCHAFGTGRPDFDHGKVVPVVHADGGDRTRGHDYHVAFDDYSVESELEGEYRVVHK